MGLEALSCIASWSALGSVALPFQFSSLRQICVFPNFSMLQCLLAAVSHVLLEKIVELTTDLVDADPRALSPLDSLA